MTLVSAVLTIFVGSMPMASIEGRVEPKACAMRFPRMENAQGQPVTARIKCGTKATIP